MAHLLGRGPSRPSEPRSGRIDAVSGGARASSRSAFQLPVILKRATTLTMAQPAHDVPPRPLLVSPSQPNVNALAPRQGVRPSASSRTGKETRPFHVHPGPDRMLPVS